MTTDVLLDDAHDLSIEQGDFVVGPSGNQHAGLIVYARPGWWKQHPWLGADYLSVLNDEENPSAFRARLQKNLELDGARVENLIMNGTELKVKGNYDA